MKQPKIILLIAIIAIALSNISCTYNESPTRSTEWSDNYSRIIYKSEWGNVAPGHWFIRLNIPNITYNVLNYGAVLVYYKNIQTNNWIQLPYSTTLYNVLNQQFSEEIWFGYAFGTLDIDYVYTNPLDMTPPDLLELKIILVRL
jgi:hypothetical protein